VIGLRFGTLFCLGALLLPAQDLQDYERKVTEFTLTNGLHFILLERHQVPVVSFHTFVNAVSTQDPAGQTGLAQIFTRLAFKGTENVGTRNWPEEKKALDDLDSLYDRMEQETSKGFRANQGKIATLQAEAAIASNSVDRLQNPDEFMRAFQENGGVGVACRATPDSVETSYSLPSNRIELWFLLESQRLAHPVFRDFYKERENMLADIKSNVESRPQAILLQNLLATAFETLPYRNPLLGWPSDVVNLKKADAKAFFDTYFVPGNIVISIVGDVDPANAQRLAERYFGSLPQKPLPPLLHTQEPAQEGPKTVGLWGSNVEPLLAIAYKRPAETHRDDLALDTVRMILGDGRTGWMYKDLVEEKRIAQDAEAVSSYPSGRYTSLFTFLVMPANDHTVEENRQALDDLVTRFQSKPVDVETLVRVKNVIRGRVARMLGSNQKLAALLPAYYVIYGDWRRLFTDITSYNQLTAEDLQRVALQYFTPANRTVGYISNGPQQGISATGVGGPQ